MRKRHERGPPSIVLKKDKGLDKTNIGIHHSTQDRGYGRVENSVRVGADIGGC